MSGGTRRPDKLQCLPPAIASSGVVNGERAAAVHLNDGWSLLDSSHDVAPGGVHLAEGAAFLGDLLHDLLRAEDRLQVQPLALPQRKKRMKGTRLPETIAGIA